MATAEQKPFLNEKERQELLDAIRANEKRTSGEIVVSIERQSNDYPQAVFLGTLVFSVTLSLVVNLALSFSVLWTGPTLPHLWVFPSVFAVSFPLALLALREIDPIRRLFIPASVMKEEVSEAAVTTFHMSGLGRTALGNGVLIYVSVFERQVHILTDHGVDDHVKKDVWESIVREMTEGIRKGEKKSALILGVEKTASVLAGPFPPRPDDNDELPNLFIDRNTMQ